MLPYKPLPNSEGLMDEQLACKDCTAARLFDTAATFIAIMVCTADSIQPIAILCIQAELLPPTAQPSSKDKPRQPTV